MKNKIYGLPLVVCVQNGEGLDIMRGGIIVGRVFNMRGNATVSIYGDVYSNCRDLKLEDLSTIMDCWNNMHQDLTNGKK